MDHPADSTTKLFQGGKNRYVGREGIPMDDSSYTLLYYCILNAEF